jgi:Cu/Zn superoxide dismutase
MRTMLVLAALAAALVVAAPASAKVKRLEARMSGANEMPTADPDGSGTAKLRLDAARKRVCFTIKVRNIGGVVAAHIHKGGKNVAMGSIVVPLIEAPKAGTKFTGCEKNVKRRLIRKILKHPRGYYVNVHTGDFPGGAIRGQLHRP